MALDNLIPSILTKRLAMGLENNLVAARLANRSYEGEISEAGDVVKVNMIADPTINNYTKNSTTLTYEELTVSQRELKIDQCKTFSFKLEDVEVKQANVDAQLPSLNRAAYGFANVADQYVLGLHAQANLSNGGAVDVTSVNVEEEILKIGRAFNEAGIPFEGRVLVVAPWVIDKIVLAGLTTKTSNDQMWSNGFVDRVLGFDVFMSQNVAKDDAQWQGTKNLAFIRGESIAYADQLTNVETLRLENIFGTGVRGQHLYGAKVMRPDKTYRWEANYKAES